MYARTYWQDHVTSVDAYQLTQQASGYYTITKAGTVMQQGTPQDQTHFNNAEVGIVDLAVAMGLMVSAVNMNEWTAQTISKTLTNTKQFPFNNSAATVALNENIDTNYVVQVHVPPDVANVGEVYIYDKLANGFKCAYTGSAASVDLTFTVIAGKRK